MRYGFYALLQVLASAAFIAMVRHMIARHLQAPDTPPRVVFEATWQGLGVILGFGLSIPLFLVFREAWLLWIIGPLLAGQVMRHRRRGLAAATAH